MVPFEMEDQMFGRLFVVGVVQMVERALVEQAVQVVAVVVR